MCLYCKKTNDSKIHKEVARKKSVIINIERKSDIEKLFFK
jgi:hypothetical protein